MKVITYLTRNLDYIYFIVTYSIVKVIFLNCVGNVFCKFDNRKMKCFYDKL